MASLRRPPETVRPLKAGRRSAEFFDDPYEFVRAVALAAGELDEFPCPGHDRSAFWCTDDRDSASASELQEPFVAQLA